MNTLKIRKCGICETECDGTVLFDICNIGLNKNDVCMCEECGNNIDRKGNTLINIMKCKDFNNLSNIKMNELFERLNK